MNWAIMARFSFTALAENPAGNPATVAGFFWARKHWDSDDLKKLLDRLGKAIIMSAEAETSEIIRRRLFEWQGLPREATATVEEYSTWGWSIPARPARSST